MRMQANTARAPRIVGPRTSRFYVAARARHSGVGRALYEALLEILKQQGFHNAFTGIALPKDASVGLHQALGFEPVGVYRNVGYKLGRWYDVSWWQRPLAAPQANPPDPLPLATFAFPGTCRAALDEGKP